MVRPTVLLTALLASTGASAQFVDYIKGALAGAVQAPLVSNTRVAAEPKEITSANWREVTDVTVPAEGETVAAEPKEWFFYFTHGNYTSPRNLTYWDGMFKDTVDALAATPAAKNLNIGKVDCNKAESDELCNTFFLADNYLPVFYHFASWPQNGSVEIREVPWNQNVTLEEQTGYYTRFFAAQQWKEVKPWTGVLNPIDGVLKDATPWLGMALKYYEKAPQWAVMLAISLIGRQVSSKLAARTTRTMRPATAPAS